MSDIVVPKWGLTTEEMVLVEWLKEIGDTVEEGEPVAEVETDKVTNELVSQITGRIVELLVDEGDSVEVGQAIARVDP